MLKLGFITDTHFTSSSNVRVGDIHEDQMEKLRWVVEWANKNKAVLIHGGDFFDKPTVPDFVKNDIISVLRTLWTPMYAIWGNHDELYGSDERNYKTSLKVLVEGGTVIHTDRVDLGECIITSRVPLVDCEKPQILTFHGFLNIEDGRNTLYFQDIVADTKALVLLGHDHVTYEPVAYKNSIIYRPGSFTRAIRNDSASRIPEMLDIECDGKDFKVTQVPILAAKQVDLIFKSKINKVQKSDVSYADIIAQIKSASKTTENLEEALRMVTDDVTIGYISNAINEYNMNKNK